MKIAVTYDNGNIFQHFGQTENFKVYNVEDNTVKSAALLNTNGNGHGALAGILRNSGIDTLICGGIGGGAKNALAAAGIKLYGGASGDADAVVNDLLAGRLSYDSDAVCTHHTEHHGDNHGENCDHHDHNCDCKH